MELSTRIPECVEELERAQRRALVVQKRLERAGQRAEEVKAVEKRFAIEREELARLGGLARVYRRFGRMLVESSAEEEQKEFGVKGEEVEMQLRGAEAERDFARQGVHLMERELSDLESREATASLTVAIGGLLKTQPSLQRSANWICFSNPRLAHE